MSDEIIDVHRFTRFPLLLESLDYAQNCPWFSDLRFILQATELIPLVSYGICRGLGTEKNGFKAFSAEFLTYCPDSLFYV